MSDDGIEALQARLREFAAERDWQQYHTPKNLAMALTGEVGELLEIFQWLTPDESRTVMEGPHAGDVKDELADVLIYLARLADVLGVDVLEAAAAKVKRNEVRFPRTQP
jgi:NTP pyrophosphatase (non-canonical NTP hydrolase)